MLVTRSCSTLAAVLLGLAITAPAFAQAPATPQAALDALEAAIKAGNPRAAMPLLTPAGQQRLAKEAVMGSLMLLVFADPDDPAPMGPKPTPAELKTRRTAYAGAKTAITAALKPSGLDAAIGKPMLPAAEISP